MHDYVWHCEVRIATNWLFPCRHHQTMLLLSVHHMIWKINTILSSNDVVWRNDSFIPFFSSLLFKPHSNTLSHDFWVLVGNAFNSAVVNCLTLTFRATVAVCAFLWWEFGPLSRWANYKVVSAIWWTELRCFIRNQLHSSITSIGLGECF